MARLFVDTGAFYALADRSDRHHSGVAAAFRELVDTEELVTSDHVVVETWFLIVSRLGRDAALRFWDATETGVVQVFGVTSSDWHRGHEIARDWPDQGFSIVDCTSFALIERYRIERAMALDRHFRVFRYGPRRDRALTLIPG